MKIGTLLLIATNNENTFSNRALFFAIPLSNLILSTKNFSSLIGISIKSLSLKELLNFFNKTFIFSFNSFLFSLSTIFR